MTERLTLSSGISNDASTASLPNDCLTSFNMMFGSPSLSGAEMSQYDKSDGMAEGESRDQRLRIEEKANEML